MMKQPLDVAVDWVAERIYWSDLEGIFSINMHNTSIIVPIVKDNLKHLTRIIVDPEHQ